VNHETSIQADLILQQPDATGAAELLLLFHGVGSTAEDLSALGHALAPHRPGAWVISVRSPDPSDFGQGWQWFSVQGVTEANRPERVALAMPRFLQRVAGWQSHTGVPPEHTTLMGFSQGAIMALESVPMAAERIAGRVVAIAGRFAQPPRCVPAGVVVNLMHGEQDPVMPISLAEDAHRALQALGATATIDRFSGLGHGIDARVVEAILRRWPAAHQEQTP
jgi:phospholipase/carboxylesterase